MTHAEHAVNRERVVRVQNGWVMLGLAAGIGVATLASSPCEPSSKSGSRKPGSSSTKRGSRTWRTHPRSRRRCCGDNRPRP